MLRIRVLGELTLDLDGEALPAPPGRRLRALLGWLALHPGMHARAEVAGRLWPDVLDESARTSLRTALADLRRALGDGHVIATRDEVGLAPGVWIDARAFDELVADRRLEEALELVRGEVLDGLAEDWVYAERDRRGEAVREALRRLAADAEAAGDLRAAIARTRERIAADPLAEDAHRDLIRRLAAAGDRPAALSAYIQLRELLARELQIAPSAQTRALASQIHSTEAAPAEAPALPLPSALARRHRSPFVGRPDELAKLREAFDRVGDGRLVLLTGEPGIGKTRLAAELARIVHGAGATVLYGRAQEEPLAPYQPFAEALGPFLAARSQDALLALVGPLAGELGRLVPAQVARLPPPAEAATRDPAGARYRLFEAAAALVAGVARERPLLLVLDDLHWADGPTLLLLRHLANAPLGPALVLGTYRPGEPSAPLADALADLRREDRFDRIAVEGLVYDDVDALVTAWLGRDAPEALTHTVRRETDGNPFFVEELLRQYAESDAGARRWEPMVPESVREVLGRRLARLDEPARDTLLLAAVAGREVELRLLEAAGGLPREALVEALDAALGAHLIREEAGAPGRYAFTHALVREAIYGELSSARRALLHGRVAAALEGLDADAAELAHHYVAAGGPRDKVIEHAGRAGRQALAQLAYEDAARHFERALVLVPDAGGLLTGLGDARLRAGDVEASRAVFSAAAAVAREGGGDGELLARAALGRSGLGATVLGHDPETVALLEDALAALGEGSAALRARLLGRLAIELYHSPPVARREQLSAEAVALARAAGDAGALADALSARHVALWSPPHLDERLALADEMVALAEAGGDREHALQGRNWRVLDLLEGGDIDAARREIDEHGRLADELRLPGYQWWTPMWGAMLAFLEGRMEAAERLRAEAVEIGRRASDRVADLFSWIQTVFVDLESEPIAPSAPTDVPDRLAVQAVQSAFRSDLPLIYAEMGRTDDARRELEALAADRFAGIAGDMNWLASMVELGQGAALLGAREHAAELYELLLPYRARSVLVGRAALCLGPVELHLGVLATALGRFADAERHLDAAAHWAAAAGARPWSAWTDVHRAELLAARGEAGAAAELAARAASEAQALGWGRAAGRARVIA